MELTGIRDWAAERSLDKNKPDKNGFVAMIVEEQGEFLEGALKGEINEGVDAICDITVFSIGEIYKYGFDAEVILGTGNIIDWLPQSEYTANFGYVEDITFNLYLFLDAEKKGKKNGLTPDQIIDIKILSMKNMVINSYRELSLMGYDADKCMVEVMKELNSRTGEYCGVSKKWQKYLTPEAEALWYKAYFTDCKI